MRILITVVIIFSILFTSVLPVISAGECNYGSLHAWFRKTGGEWQNSTAHPRLKRGEEFEIKTMISTKKYLAVVFLKLHEFGTPVYEVVEGPSMIDKILQCGHAMKPNQMFTYQWKLRVKPNTTWVNGYGPLEIFVQFNKNDDESEVVRFDVLTAYILDDPWEGYLKETGNETINHSNASIKFQTHIFLAVIVLLIFISLRKKIY